MNCSTGRRSRAVPKGFLSGFLVASERPLNAPRRFRLRDRGLGEDQHFGLQKRTWLLAMASVTARLLAMLSNAASGLLARILITAPVQSLSRERRRLLRAIGSPLSARWQEAVHIGAAPMIVNIVDFRRAEIDRRFTPNSVDYVRIPRQPIVGCVPVALHGLRHGASPVLYRCVGVRPAASEGGGLPLEGATEAGHNWSI